ncbi:type 1 glutamine amidotransferase domain-containing protein [Arthrobacter ginkgonis]|uniref:Type 1 glutamine amidotransferase domain-containing protein n=1 Tax=Arthrobacter ginkgonis TaxID=1630594 RepID=A0ABP7BS68_9MICC
MSKILFLMTGADHWTLADGTTHPTGYWADEAVIPYEKFKAEGHQVAVATPGGVRPPVDHASLSPRANGGPENAERVKAVVSSAPEFQEPLDLEAVRLDDFDAVYVPGGHGPMEDLAVDGAAGRILRQALETGLPTGIVCHGPAALLAAVSDGGANAYAGYRVTAFSNAEERKGGKADKARWLLEDRLNAAGLTVKTGEAFAPHVEIDRNLVTGQNPASAGPVAVELLKKLAG